MIRIGQGYDVHPLVVGRECKIGGVSIPYEKGLLGHSDADVLLHAITDAILGALARGDIGTHFPDDQLAYKDMDSSIILKEVWKLAVQDGFKLGNVDVTIIAQLPKMAPYIQEMRKNLAALLCCNLTQINVKATTHERLGSLGRGEGIACLASVLLEKEGI